MQRLQAVAAAQQAAGMKAATITVGPEEHPWAAVVGFLKDSPLWDEWRKAIEEYREQVDNDPNR